MRSIRELLDRAEHRVTEVEKRVAALARRAARAAPGSAALDEAEEDLRLCRQILDSMYTSRDLMRDTAR